MKSLFKISHALSKFARGRVKEKKFPIKNLISLRKLGAPDKVLGSRKMVPKKPLGKLSKNGKVPVLKRKPSRSIAWLTQKKPSGCARLGFS